MYLNASHFTGEITVYNPFVINMFFHAALKHKGLHHYLGTIFLASSKEVVG
jgi:hypothetical protein